jgi:hypothetical protein
VIFENACKESLPKAASIGNPESTNIIGGYFCVDGMRRLTRNGFHVRKITWETVFPAIRAVIWFNENKETDWRIESSRTAQAAFDQAVASRIYASNQFAKLNAVPVPVP